VLRLYKLTRRCPCTQTRIQKEKMEENQPVGWTTVWKCNGYMIFGTQHRMNLRGVGRESPDIKDSNQTRNDAREVIFCQWTCEARAASESRTDGCQHFKL